MVSSAQALKVIVANGYSQGTCSAFHSRDYVILAPTASVCKRPLSCCHRLLFVSNRVGHVSSPTRCWNALEPPEYLVSRSSQRHPIIVVHPKKNTENGVGSQQFQNTATGPCETILRRPSPPLYLLPEFLPLGRSNVVLGEQPHFTNFMVAVEQGYGSGTGPGEINIYHNRRHATDVTQAVHYFLKVSFEQPRATNQPLRMTKLTRPGDGGAARGHARRGCWCSLER